MPKSASSGFIPRAPTGSEWSRSRGVKGSESDLIGITDVLRDLDQKAALVH